MDYSAKNVPTIFRNIVGIIPRSELFDFKLDDRLAPETARYFIRKSAMKYNLIDKETGLTYNEYTSYIYSTGYDTNKYTEGYIKQSRCLDMWNSWRFSFNDRDFLDSEMIEIDMSR